MDVSRLDAVLQFALAAASQEDDRQNRELGPIHLIKYVYLADLAFAEKHGGETFTGARWRFYHFGPWASEVFERIEPAAGAVAATRRTFTGAKYDGESVRYALTDETVFERLLKNLPWEVTGSIRRELHEHGTDTYGLLDHVYRTRPMLRAAPGEYLAFKPETPQPLQEAVAPSYEMPLQPSAAMPSPAEIVENFVLPERGPTWKELRARKEAVAKLREEVRKRLEARIARRGTPVRPPRYDEVFFEGVRWLDEQAGGPIDPFEGEAAFSPDIWKSPGRSDPDVP